MHSRPPKQTYLASPSLYSGGLNDTSSWNDRTAVCSNPPDNSRKPISGWKWKDRLMSAGQWLDRTLWKHANSAPTCSKRANNEPFLSRAVIAFGKHQSSQRAIDILCFLHFFLTSKTTSPTRIRILSAQNREWSCPQAARRQCRTDLHWYVGCKFSVDRIVMLSRG